MKIIYILFSDMGKWLRGLWNSFWDDAWPDLWPVLVWIGIWLGTVIFWWRAIEKYLGEDSADSFAILLVLLSCLSTGALGYVYVNLGNMRAYFKNVKRRSKL